ncbi:hypothetical protein [Trebonia sp.]|uniref:hypothetical protein n=1 Tax=Trebonia sp. TaxID=2767075 RepID=UPI00262791DD|nr:hypothetical protein [Trebonia sp.]
MIDMSTWNDLQADVIDNLRLDPRNVRLELPLHDVPETDIIRDLFANEKAFNLVEAIASVGYLTHEVPIVVIRDGEMVVVEGNRRVAALKAIQNPFLVPEYRVRIAKLAERIPDRDVLKKISVKLAPNQDEADQLIAALHTGNLRLPWSPARQAAFFQAQIDSGKSLKQLLEQYPLIDVKDFVIRSQMVNLFRSVRYKDPDLRDYVYLRRFPLSTLARLYENAEFQDLAHIVVNEPEATVTIKRGKRQFARLAEKIISDIKAKRIDTRVLNSTNSYSYKKYMDELRDLINDSDADEPDETDESAQDGGTTGQGTGGSSDKTGGPADPDEKSKPKSGSSNYLDLEGIDPSGFPPAIGYIATELSLINVNRFPNAAFDLLRTFLEKTIKAYAASLGQDIKKGSNSTGYVYLANALVWLEEHVKSTGHTALIQVVQKVRGGKVEGYVSSKSHMDAINHNYEIFATPTEVREAWNTMRALLLYMLKP